MLHICILMFTFFLGYSVECFDLIYPLDYTRGPPVIISSQGKQLIGGSGRWSCAKKFTPIYKDTICGICGLSIPVIWLPTGMDSEPQFSLSGFPVGLDKWPLWQLSFAHRRITGDVSSSAARTATVEVQFWGGLKRWILLRLPSPPASHIFEIEDLLGPGMSLLKVLSRKVFFLNVWAGCFFFSGFTTLNSGEKWKNIAQPYTKYPDRTRAMIIGSC